MQLHIHAITHQPDVWLRDAELHYLHRIPKPYSLNIHHISPNKRDKYRSVDEIKNAEASLLLKNTAPRDFLCYLDPHGKPLTSEAFSTTLSQWREQHTTVRFMLGGAEGHSKDALSNAHAILSLSTMTLPHGLARLLLVEQIYRAIMIQNKHPYHR